MMMNMSDESRKAIEEKLADKVKKHRKEVHGLFHELKTVRNDGKRKYAKVERPASFCVVYCIPDDRIDIRPPM